jgi:intracellular multiplication protein IcmP
MAAQQQQPGQDNGMAPIWILVIVFLVGYVVWHEAHQYIVSFFFFLNIWQAKLIQLAIDSPDLANTIMIMETVDPKSVDWSQLMLLSTNVGEYARYPVLTIMGVLAIWLYQSDITQKFRKTHNMKSLSKQEQHNWNAIMPIIKEDLVSMDVNTGPWAMAMTPMEFGRKHGLLKKDDALLDKSKPGEEMTAGIRRGDAKRVFTLQLGPYWDGFDRCPPHARALLAVFMSRINRDRDSATLILSTLDKGAALGKIDYSVANSAIRKHQNSQLVQDIIHQHAYLLTVMASLLAAARDDGVVPSSEFLWLKPVDRRLWYMLNCVGRQTPFVEVAGPFAHWKAEKAMKRSLLAPMIDEAIKAFEIAVKEVKLSPKEMQELTP